MTKSGIRHLDPVVAGATLEGIEAATAGYDIVALAADKDVGRRGTGQAVGGVRSRMCDRAVEIAALDDINRAIVGPAAAVMRRSGDGEIVIAVAIDVAQLANGAAGEIARSGAGDLEALGAVAGCEGGEVDIASAAGFAIDHIGFAGIRAAAGIGPLRADGKIVDFVAIDVADAD